MAREIRGRTKPEVKSHSMESDQYKPAVTQP